MLRLICGIVFVCVPSVWAQPEVREAALNSASPCGPLDDVSPIEAGKASPLCGHAYTARPDLFPMGPGRAPRIGGVDNTDITHYRLELEFNILPDFTYTISGDNQVNVTVVGSPISDFELELDDAYSASVSGNVTSWSHTNDLITMTLDRTYDPGESFQVVVAYDGNPWQAYAIPLTSWVFQGKMRFATLSEPFDAPGWWPCKNSLSDKATAEIIITVPDPLVVASNGLLQSTTPLSGDRTQYHWLETNPIADYLISLAIADYKIYNLTYEYDDGQGGAGTMPVPCYLYSEHWNNAANAPSENYQLYSDPLLDMLSAFESAAGPYPFRNEKYGVAETSGLFANMEHQTMTSMVQYGYTDVMSHELAHQWFGDNVTCGTWHDIWLNEGLASYFEAVYRERRPGGGREFYWISIIDHIPSNRRIQVYRPDASDSDEIFSFDAVYRKGAWVCHMLRHVMGDEAFFQALTDYNATYGGGFATTADFAAAMSSTFGHDLSFFTDQWVMNPGAPRYVWRYNTKLVDNSNYLYLQIEQQQNSVGDGLFTMPIDIRITTSAGVSVHRIWNDDWIENYVIPIDGTLVDVEFDEEDGDPIHNYILAASKAFEPTAPALPPVILAKKLVAYSGPSGDASVSLTFSDDIGTLDAVDVALTGANSGVHPAASVSYEPASQTATVTFAALPNDTYVLRVISSGISANGAMLDGEVDDSAWYDDVLLPSGDGQPGGDAVFAFSISAGDADCNGTVNLDDIGAFTSVLLGIDAPPCNALRSDTNNDGRVDGLDIPGFLAQLTQ
ncbi:MAG: hypothetical protein H6819_03900 [Phycisphaerales bacterium]|nr:hypothetical protein [Phycisphaerales bacterium]MCB9856342.1 hypothetical protein [Phycisphaerales bacterium]MCB9864014.1 hypothetical protein [Phycisphaerales bacterium]